MKGSSCCGELNLCERWGGGIPATVMEFNVDVIFNITSELKRSEWKSFSNLERVILESSKQNIFSKSRILKPFEPSEHLHLPRELCRKDKLGASAVRTKTPH